MYKGKISSLISKETKLRKNEVLSLLESPPNVEMGDYAFPCFVLSKKQKKKSPVEIAEELAKSIKPVNPIERVESKGPYLNFFLSKKIIARDILEIDETFGKSDIGKNKTVVFDFSHPNVGKPMHVGHIRSTIIGDSMMRTYNYLGYNPVGINYLGDVGLHIGKLIVAYEMWLDKDALKKDPTKELLRLYVKFCSKEKTEITEGMEEEMQDNEWTNKAKEKVKQLELGNKKAHKIWNDIRKSSEKGFNKVYDMLKVSFTETTGQSYFSNKGKEIITNALLKKKVKSESDGALYVDLEGQKKYVLRSNKTAFYITQDIGAAVSRFEKYKFDKMVYITDFRQEGHFNHLFDILKLFGFKFHNKLNHLPFGTIRFGKEIMATRTGKVIQLEEVLQKTIKKAEQSIKKRKRKGDAEKVGVGAIKYIVLKNEPIRDVNFSWEAALSFEGNTGPYLQYSYARASSLLKKAGKKKNSKPTIPEINEQEYLLLLKMSKFKEVIEKTAERMSPAIIANYSYELAKLFNEFYQNNKILGEDKEEFRLRLIDSFRKVLKRSLHLLGVEVMEEM
jgi:arginyl-tRNA synthetase